MAGFVILWMLCSGLAYFVAKENAPSKAGTAAALGFALGPIGVAIAFMMKESK